MGMTQLLYVWLVWRLLAGLLSAWALVATSAWALSWLAVTGRAQWAGLIYSGVGLGIMLAGVFCLLAARSGICATTLWRWLALLAALLSLLPLYWCQRHAQVPVVASAQAAPPADAPASSAGLVLCYGLFGFGYILPATYLPQMARRLLDDPTVFGWTWPLFGLAALLSTLMTLCARQRVSRVRAWALAQLLMALGVLLPALWPTLSALLLAALLVGGNFMVITMLGMQEARARAPHQATRVLGRMTAAFALGQLAGPLLMLLLQCRPATQGHALTLALVSGAASLLFSAAYLWRCPSA
jgi:MFS family permease